RPVFTAAGVMFPAEDPFIWFGPDRYWAVVKDNEGHFTHAGKSLALFESRDGIDWKLAEHPLVSTIGVKRPDGSVQPLHSLERPQLLFEGGVPTTLYCAVDESSRREHSYNVQVPLGP
ncbi:MAG: sucrase, partial [Armatimonadetes bacterium]|nr:sucrase [Armatimonadota bacterium]